jgi:hypothetical protein
LITALAAGADLAHGLELFLIQPRQYERDDRLKLYGRGHGLCGLQHSSQGRDVGRRREADFVTAAMAPITQGSGHGMFSSKDGLPSAGKYAGVRFVDAGRDPT